MDLSSDMAILYDNKKSLLGNLGVKTAPTPVVKTAPIVKSVPTTTPRLPAPPVQKQVTVPKSTPALPQRPNSFFKGGFIDKAFDILRVPEYALAGFNRGTYAEKERMTGKPMGNYQDIISGRIKPQLPTMKDLMQLTSAGLKNVIPGIQTRTSFSSAPGDINIADKAFGLKNKAAQDFANTTVGFGSPTLPVGKIAKFSGVSKILETLGKGTAGFAKGSPILSNVVEKFSPYFRNPEVGKLVQESEGVVSKRLTTLYDLLKGSIKKLSPAEQSRVGQLLEGGITTNPRFEEIAAPIRRITTQISKELLDQGKLTPETFKKFEGRYMTHIFEEAAQGNPIINAMRTMPGVSSQFFKQRKNAEGYVKQFAPAVFKGLGSEIKSIEATNLYKKIAGKFGRTYEDAKQGDVLAEKLIKNPEIAKYFKGTVVPQHIVDYINRLETIPDKQNFIGKLTNLWKQGVTIYNPAYHARNIISNQMLSNYSTGKGIPATVMDFMRSAVNYAGKGEQRFAKGAKDTGLIKNPNIYEGTQEFLDKAFNRNNPIKNVVNFPKRFQQATEETSKLSVFRSAVEREANRLKIPVEEALQNSEILQKAKNVAEEAIFSPYRISKTERGIVGNSIPFYSFARQALPFFAKTAVKTPNRVIGAPRYFDYLERNSVGNAPEKPKSLEGQIDIGQNPEGKDVFFNPQYITPYGNFDSGMTLDKGQLPFGLSLNPMLQFLTNALYKKSAFTGQELYNSNVPEENIKQGLSEARRSFTPTFINSVIDKIVPAMAGQPDYTGGTRSLPQSLVDSVLGLKTKAYDRSYLKGKVQNEKNARLRSVQSEFRNSNSPQLRSRLRGIYEKYQSNSR